MKFVVLLGSLRKDSLNAAVARALPELAPAGVTIEPLGSIVDFPHYDADLQAQRFPEAVTAMADAIRAADGLIIVSPEYNYSIPGALKNALDWLSRLPDQPLAGKPVAIQTASPGAIGGMRMQHHLRQVLVFFRAYTLPGPEISIGGAAGKIEGGVLTDETTRKFIAGQLEGLAAWARRLAE